MAQEVALSREVQKILNQDYNEIWLTFFSPESKTCLHLPYLSLHYDGGHTLAHFLYWTSFYYVCLFIWYSLYLYTFIVITNIGMDHWHG